VPEVTGAQTSGIAAGRWRVGPWAAVVAASGVAAVALRSRPRSPLAAGAMVLAGQAVAFAAARGGLRHALDVQARRRAYERARSRVYSDLLVDVATHGPLGRARDQLRRLPLRDLELPVAGPVSVALRRIEEIERELAETAHERATADTAARDRRLGGFASAAPSRRDDPLRLYGVRPSLPAGVPQAVGIVVQQVGAVLDEVRLLHTEQLEWSALLFTLWSRAALLVLGPRLPGLTAAPVATRLPSGALEPAWTLATGFAVATATVAPAVATSVMDRSAAGATVRRRLLTVEVPLACTLAFRQPSWLACTFATGWTNWWQRPEFDWPRLGVFVAGLSAIQAVGLRRHRIAASRILGEVAATLFAVFYTGGSYGAMVPLSASAAAEVMLRGGMRQALASGAARRRMLLTATALRDAGDALAGTDAGDDAARAILEAAARLERSAQSVDQPPQVLGDLVATAYRRSEVPLRDSAEAERRRADAKRVGDDPPAELRTPTYRRGEPLRTARVLERKNARALHDIVVVCLEEAEAHGTGPVHVVWDLVDGRLVLCVANRRRTRPRPGLRGSGGPTLKRLVGRLPGDADVDLREEVDGSFVGMQPRPGWFGVQVSCPASVLADSPRKDRDDGHE
jgi:hypothetical protein